MFYVRFVLRRLVGALEKVRCRGDGFATLFYGSHPTFLRELLLFGQTGQKDL